MMLRIHLSKVCRLTAFLRPASTQYDNLFEFVYHDNLGFLKISSKLLRREQAQRKVPLPYVVVRQIQMRTGPSRQLCTMSPAPSSPFLSSSLSSFGSIKHPSEARERVCIGNLTKVTGKSCISRTFDVVTLTDVGLDVNMLHELSTESIGIGVRV